MEPLGAVLSGRLLRGGGSDPARRDVGLPAAPALPAELTEFDAGAIAVGSMRLRLRFTRVSGGGGGRAPIAECSNVRARLTKRIRAWQRARRRAYLDER